MSDCQFPAGCVRSEVLRLHRISVVATRRYLAEAMALAFTTNGYRLSEVSKDVERVRLIVERCGACRVGCLAQQSALGYSKIPAGNGVQV